MTTDTPDFRPTLKERIVMRLLGVRISRDGCRWTAPRKRADFIEAAMRRSQDEAWRQGTTTRVERAGDVMTYAGPERTITIRFVP